MGKIKISKNIVKFLKGAHPLFKFFSLIIIFFSLGLFNSLVLVILYFVTALSIILMLDGLIFFKQIKTIYPILLLVLIYSFFLTFESSLSFHLIIQYFILRSMELLTMLAFSYIFIKTSSKYQLIRISVFILYPFTYLIDKKVITNIMVDTLNIAPKMAKNLKDSISNMKNNGDRFYYIKILDISADFFNFIIDNPPETKKIPEHRLTKIVQFKNPRIHDYIFLLIITVVTIGTLSI
ncbi:MAG: hypothetical protein C0187_02160 [Calditerrivibrio nitroreducens]|uniref:Cobalt transport protein n=1 Tax=Calditerrivibrio nitroreducens TaxID=477976 RepID=A0A2J6WPA5_9BACT|nr:MAG: hypothetical protein C0187_02160 [Calditerrivibrio nitroreducens]